MSSSQDQGGPGHARAAFEVALPVVACLPQQHRQVPIILSPERRTHNRPMVWCFMLSCIVLCLAIILACVAVLAVVVVYHPKSPQPGKSDARLNAGYVDELTFPGDPSTGLALNADLTVLAIVSSNNTKIDVVLRYMELNLYFEGKMIGTQVMQPAPLRERPSSSEPRNAHFVVSEVALSPEDVVAWRNMTADGGLVVLHLAGRFRTQLIIGPLLRYTYWVYPHCTLWLEPPPRGTKRQARCYV